MRFIKTIVLFLLMNASIACLVQADTTNEIADFSDKYFAEYPHLQKYFKKWLPKDPECYLMAPMAALECSKEYVGFLEKSQASLIKMMKRRIIQQGNSNKCNNNHGSDKGNSIHLAEVLNDLIDSEQRNWIRYVKDSGEIAFASGQGSSRYEDFAQVIVGLSKNRLLILVKRYYSEDFGC